MYYDKHKQFFNDMNYAYRCMRVLQITDELTSKLTIMLLIQYYYGDS